MTTYPEPRLEHLYDMHVDLEAPQVEYRVWTVENPQDERRELLRERVGIGV